MLKALSAEHDNAISNLIFRILIHFPLFELGYLGIPCLKQFNPMNYTGPSLNFGVFGWPHMVLLGLHHKFSY